MASPAIITLTGSETLVTSPELARAAEAVVVVADDEGRPYGSGVFVGSGLVLTCAHVVVPNRAGSALVTWRGTPLPATVLASEPMGGGSGQSSRNLPDLALLQLRDATGIDHAILTVSQVEPPAGSQLNVYGYVQGISVASPELWVGRLELEGSTGDLLRLRGGELGPGMSGGPVVELETGHLVGVVKAANSRFGGFAVPGHLIRAFLRRFGVQSDPIEDHGETEDPGDTAREAALGPAEEPPSSVRADIGTRGFTDAPASVDQLGRGALVDVLVDLLSPNGSRADWANAAGWPIEDTEEERPGKWPEDHEGPRVIAIDGPWGSGKTTIMRLIHDRLRMNASNWKSSDRATWSRRRGWTEWQRSRRLTALGAHRLLSVWRRSQPGWDEKPHAEPKPTRQRPPMVARFEPWAHQSSEQLWAGLTKVITRAAVSAICGSPGAARRFWFARNAERLDVSRLRRQLWKGVASPLLRLSAIVATVPVVVQLLRPETTARVLGMTPLALAWLLPALVLTLGLLHTACRYLFGRAAAFLPEELFEGPVLSGGLAVASPDPSLRDPLYHAQSGSLYLVQHDVALVLHHLRESGRELVVFVDDLDRCNPQAVTEVLQAINLFLSGNLAGCRFVIGLDLVAVAAQVNEAYVHVSSEALCHGDDPTPGWSFLRKLIQLPVTLPRPSEERVEGYLNDLLRTERLSPASVAEVPEKIGTSTPPAPAVEGGTSAPAEPAPGHVQRAAIRRGYVERDEKVRRILLERILAAPEPSGRESKRLVTIWQFYVRRMLLQNPDMSLADMVALSQHLVLVAEVVARWPALARQLRTMRDNHCGLHQLATTADNYLKWSRVVRDLRLDESVHAKALEQLRQLLLSYDGIAVADLFEQIETGQPVQAVL
ncbi:P-loop NTPase fold protein [Micromonospora sp. CPCC 205539]|uniref:P-loop NTPase fold protein n=1 Tax=Micromonospora sp. CPCC 205539 TaxID=3122408 RepID=UPI002FF2BDDF